MADQKEDFYTKCARMYKTYDFKGKGRLIGEQRKPDFSSYARYFVSEGVVALDLGCGSGELAEVLAEHSKQIHGVDPCIEFIETAKSNSQRKNVCFTVADGRNLPYPNDHFDVVYSSRGPLSADIGFMRESYRVLRPGGYMVEETIGEDDKYGLKTVFGRGQNYPPQETKMASVQGLLDELSMELMDSQYFVYQEFFPTLESVLELLDHAPIIPDFDREKDEERIRDLDIFLTGSEGTLSSHRLLWVARK